MISINMKNGIYEYDIHGNFPKKKYQTLLTKIIIKYKFVENIKSNRYGLNQIFLDISHIGSMNFN